jgi:hypothetical protein
MIARSQGERMLTDDERAVLELWKTQGAAGYPIQKYAGKWTWDYRSLKAPRMYSTKQEAVTAFEGYVAVLVDAARVEQEQRYAATDPRPARYVAEPGDG